MYQEMKKFIESGVVPEFFTYGGFKKFEGKEEGIEEQTRNIAKNLLALNMNIKDIMVATGLSKKELNELLNDKKSNALEDDCY